MYLTFKILRHSFNKCFILSPKGLGALLNDSSTKAYYHQDIFSIIIFKNNFEGSKQH